MHERLEGALREKPLKKGEVRQIEGMGELYFSRLSQSEIDAEYDYLFSLAIGGAAYGFYRRLTDRHIEALALDQRERPSLLPPVDRSR